MGDGAPGTRKSLYQNAEYQKAAPFAAVTLQAMQTADPTNPAIRPVPYTGVQFVGIPEFQSFGTVVGQNVAGALAGKMTVDARRSRPARPPPTRPSSRPGSRRM